ncbi:MAG: DUF1501 domain-containing protein [Granulosicoccus sp.]
MNTFSRRRFLKTGGQTIAGAGLALSGNPFKALAYGAETTQALGADYRALVCIYLEGGCDGFSLMVPTGNYENRVFAESRGNLSVGYDELIALNGGASPIGLHNRAASLQPLFDEGRLAMIANVGTLIEPTTAEQYRNNEVAIPSQLFSHSDQTIQWQQLQGRGRGVDGWGAKAVDFLEGYQSNDYLTSISLAGSNYWQTGTTRRPFSMTEAGALDYRGLSTDDNWEQPRAEAFRHVLDLQRRHVISKAYADLQKRAMSVTAELGLALEGNASLFEDTPAENPLAEKLSMVAQIIAARETLGLKRQIFYVTMSGFDVHDNLSTRQPELFAQLADAMSFFQRKMDTLGQSENVTAFTASDFGRSLLSNGDGTDHGWGNHLMAMGGAVKGGAIYGTLPSLDINGPDSVHRGRVLPTLSATQYAATLLDWIGLQDDQIGEVLPTLNNFNIKNLDFMI